MDTQLSDLVDAGSIPAYMMAMAVESMDKVVEVANEVIEQEKEGTDRQLPHGHTDASSHGWPGCGRNWIWRFCGPSSKISEHVAEPRHYDLRRR